MGAWLLRIVLTQPPYYLHLAINAQKLIIKTPCQSGVSTTILTSHKCFKYCVAAFNRGASGGSKNGSSGVTGERTSNYFLRIGSAAIDRRADGRPWRC